METFEKSEEFDANEVDASSCNDLRLARVQLKKNDPNPRQTRSLTLSRPVMAGVPGVISIDLDGMYTANDSISRAQLNANQLELAFTTMNDLGQYIIEIKIGFSPEVLNALQEAMGAIFNGCEFYKDEI